MNSPLRRTFRTTVLERAARDVRFRERLLTEAIDQLLAGDLAAGKAMLRDYINATMTFERLARALKKSSKSLHRMLGPSGNPTAESLFGIIKALQAHERVQLQVKSHRSAA
jgi:DNA-binding phage protein